MADKRRDRLFFLGFGEAGGATSLLELIKESAKQEHISVADWAMIQKGDDGKATITTDRSVDPGAARGAGFGGLAGAVVAVVSGPIGIGAVVGGAAIGAIAAGLKDSGIKGKDLESISHLMASGRSGLVIAVPLDDAARFEAFLDRNGQFAADRTLWVDIVPGLTLTEAIEDYIEHEED
jgi:uncharacterized membrane protein